MRWLGFLLVSIPFGFGALRALGTGTDFRYLWVACAAALPAAMIFRLRGARTRSTVTRLSLAVVASTIGASAVGFLLGARSLPAVLFVAVGFAICEAGGFTLVHREQGS